MMTTPPDKPRAVIYAQSVLFAWTVWICAFGVFRSWSNGGQPLSQVVNTLGLSIGSLGALVLAGYVLVALSMVWVIVKVGEGKRWTRTSLLASLVLEVLWATQSDNGVWDYIGDAADTLFQLAALYLLYTKPGRNWFVEPSRAAMPDAYPTP